MRKAILQSLFLVFLSQLTFGQAKKPANHKKKYQKQLKWTGKFAKQDKDMIAPEPK
jgi:hypothetical protein